MLVMRYTAVYLVADFSTFRLCIKGQIVNVASALRRVCGAASAPMRVLKRFRTLPLIMREEPNEGQAPKLISRLRLGRAAPHLRLQSRELVPSLSSEFRIVGESNREFLSKVLTAC